MPLTATHLPTIINHAGSRLTRRICSSLTTSLWVKALVQARQEAGQKRPPGSLPPAFSHGAETLSLLFRSPASPVDTGSTMRQDASVEGSLE